MSEQDNNGRNGKRPFSFHTDLSVFMLRLQKKKAQQDIMRPPVHSGEMDFVTSARINWLLAV